MPERVQKRKKMDRKRGLIIRMAAAAAIVILLAFSASISPLQEGFRAVTNYPNPFDSRVEKTTILFTLDSDSAVSVRIYDLFGNIVRDYNFGMISRGPNRLVWDGTNEAGEKVAKGGYICVMEIANDRAKLIASRKIGVIH